MVQDKTILLVLGLSIAPAQEMSSTASFYFTNSFATISFTNYCTPQSAHREKPT